MIYTGLLSLLLAEYAANQKCSAVLLCRFNIPPCLQYALPPIDAGYSMIHLLSTAVTTVNQSTNQVIGIRQLEGWIKP